jgi:hypothetical protein
MLWLRTSFCPTLQETEGVQTITNELLDAADAAADDGLPRRGYTLLGVDACASLQHPSNRASLTSYAQTRGLTLVFGERTGEALRPRAIERLIFPRDEASACLSRALASAPGWNDPHVHLSLNTRSQPHQPQQQQQQLGGRAPYAGARAASASSTAAVPRTFEERLRALRVRFAQACMHRRPLVLSPFPLAPRPAASLAPAPARVTARAAQAEHARLVSLLTDRHALALHASPFNTSAAAAIAQRHPLRIAAGAEGVQAWVRHMAPRGSSYGVRHMSAAAVSAAARALPISSQSHPNLVPISSQSPNLAPISSLLLVNTNAYAARAVLPWDAMAPHPMESLFAVRAWNYDDGAASGAASGANGSRAVTGAVTGAALMGPSAGMAAAAAGRWRLRPGDVASAPGRRLAPVGGHGGGSRGSDGGGGGGGGDGHGGAVVPLGVPLTAMLRSLEVPPLDVMLLILFPACKCSPRRPSLPTGAAPRCDPSHPLPLRRRRRRLCCG